VRIIDITRELFSCSVYPGDTAPSFERVKSTAEDGYNLTNISLCVHNGTHADAPCHFIEGGTGIDGISLETFYGECTVAEAEGKVGAEEMLKITSDSKDRLLIKGDCIISDAAIGVIARSHIKLIGVENQSVSDPAAPMRGHMMLLEKGIIPIEGLDLSRAAPGGYILAAFPLKMEGLDGSPIRAVLILP